MEDQRFLHLKIEQLENCVRELTNALELLKTGHNNHAQILRWMDSRDIGGVEVPADHPEYVHFDMRTCEKL